MALPERQSSPQVTLRPAAPRDADLLRQWRAEASVRRYQPLNELPTAQLRADVASQRMADLYRGRGEKFQWIVQVDGQPAGWITLVVSNWEHGLAEVGYALSTVFQSRGVMSDALAILLDDLFHNTLLERVEARCAVENVGSQRVLEKSGFEREGRLQGYFKLRGRRVDNFLYALLREAYLSQRGRG
ncbi:MAG TPA: GNAT family protein [Thermoanaerobaculia bacterium]|jgi:ribosomal-protein-alanine N-acetyltransferase|nr:GNAT family protein [Thermoanaerobaculia bacterium]